MSRVRITTIVNNFTVAMNSKSQAACCCLDDRQTEHEYKRPTLVAPLDRKSSAHLILAVHPCMRYQPSLFRILLINRKVVRKKTRKEINYI